MPGRRPGSVSSKLLASILGSWSIFDPKDPGSKEFDLAGPATISFGQGYYPSRLRLMELEEWIDWRVLKRGIVTIVEFSWRRVEGDESVSGKGRLKLDKDGILRGTVKRGDGSSLAIAARRGVRNW